MLLQNPKTSISYVPRDCNKTANVITVIASKEHLYQKCTYLLQRISPILSMDFCNQEKHSLPKKQTNK